MSEAMTDFGRRCQAQVVGDKWPWYIDYLETVLVAFPDARFIYNVRDPRGVWNSAQRFKGRGRGDELLRKMLARDRAVSAYLRRGNFLTVRYEDLVREPAATCRRLYRFLNRSYSNALLKYEPDEDPYPERWDWVPQASEPFDPWHTVKWREQMRPVDIKRVTEQAAWFMEKYRYEP
jgi:hypothetical protein